MGALGKIGQGLRIAVDTLLGPFSNFVGCVLGIFGGGITEFVYSGGVSHPLPPIAKRIMGHFFPTLNLDKVRLRWSVPIPFGRAAMALGYDIYFSETFDECSKRDMRVLMHELVHVRQYEARGWFGSKCEYGRQWLDRGYEASYLEIEAESFKENHLEELYDMMEPLCQAKESVVARAMGRSGGSFWTIWGGCP